MAMAIIALYAGLTRRPGETVAVVWDFGGMACMCMLGAVWLYFKYISLRIDVEQGTIERIRHTLLNVRRKVFALSQSSVAPCQITSYRTGAVRGYGLVFLMGEKQEPFLLVAAASKVQVDDFARDLPDVFRDKVTDELWTIQTHEIGLGW
jgi:hypothetical protein